MAEKPIRTETGATFMGGDGIVRFRSFPGTSENLASAQENVAAFEKICDGKKRPFLVDITNTQGATRAARLHYSTNGTFISAVAMVVPSTLSKVIGSFFLGLNKPRHPVRLFTSESEAVEWLKGFQR